LDFDHADYDVEADAAYLSIGEPRRAIGEESPEGHVVLFDEDRASSAVSRLSVCSRTWQAT
jgi:hypothetical protein